MIHKERLKTRPVENDDHVITLEAFLEAVQAGAFIDYDGFGYYADAVQGLLYPQVVVVPSDVKKGKLRTEFSHVVWFNR